MEKGYLWALHTETLGDLCWTFCWKMVFNSNVNCAKQSVTGLNWIEAYGATNSAMPFTETVSAVAIRGSITQLHSGIDKSCRQGRELIIADSHGPTSRMATCGSNQTSEFVIARLNKFNATFYGAKFNFCIKWLKKKLARKRDFCE